MEAKSLLFRYPVYALRNGCFFPFIKAMPSIYKRKLQKVSDEDIRLSGEQVYMFKMLSQNRYYNYSELEDEKEKFTYLKYLRSLF